MPQMTQIIYHVPGMFIMEVDKKEGKERKERKEKGSFPSDFIHPLSLLVS